MNKPIEETIIRYNKDRDNDNGESGRVKYCINLGNTYAGKSDNNVNYIYFIFPAEIQECYGIKVVNKDTNNTKKDLEITEFMVFNENPIPYISERKRDTQLHNIFDFDLVKNNTGLSLHDQIFLLFNKNPGLSKTIPDKIIEGNENRNPLNWVDIFLREKRHIEQIVVREDSPVTQNEISDIFEHELFVLLDSTAKIIEMRYYNEEYLVNEMRNLSSLNYFYTPFFYSEGDNITKYPGNPLPYAAKGIDSPRTFAYKMYKQRKAREWYRNQNTVQTNAIVRFGDGEEIKTTLAYSGDNIVEYKNGYVSEMDIANALGRQLSINQFNFTYNDFNYQTNYNSIAGANEQLLKPYLPGLILNTDECIVKGDSLYQADKIAGVDSLGMVLGAFTMAEIDKSLKNLNGIDIKEEVSDYYKMNEDQIGLDTGGKPVFYPGSNQEDSYLESTYRLTRSDFEGVTVIVPDIKLIRPGDIIIKFNENNEAHIGIIVKTGWGDNYDNAPNTIDEQMNQVVVASIKKGFRMALIGTWGNPNGIFGGFAENPKEYHVRRFLVDSGDEAPEEEDWELVKRIYTELVCTRVQSDGIEHWIPNTKILEDNEKVYERLDIGKIRIRGIASDSGERDLPAYLKDIKVLPPVDYAFSEYELPGLSNIYTNKGSGLALYAKRQIGTSKEYKLMVVFEIDNTIDNPEAGTHYRINPDMSPLYDDNELNINSKYRLFVNTENNLTLVYQVNDNEVHIFDEFAVSSYGDNPRPGDDYLLRFGIAGAEGINGTMKEGDFVAQYDKKLLWRAHLYIDERKNAGDGTWKTQQGLYETKENFHKRLDQYDWNGQNPWIVDNEWNIDYDDKNGNGNTAEAGNGGQIEIRKWTRPDEDNAWQYSEENTTIYTAVPYGWGGYDELSDFNEKMDKQKKAMETAGKNPDGTLAPDNDWNNYKFPVNEENETIDQLTKRPEYKWPDNGENPYVPSLTTILNLKGYYSSNQLGFSAGLDCSGFATKVARYDNTIYSVGPHKESTNGIVEDSWEMPIVPGDGVPRILVPGDIIVTGENHVAIIYDITFIEGTREAKFNKESVLLIESTSTDGNYMVVIKFTWGEDSLYKSFRARRFKTKN